MAFTHKRAKLSSKLKDVGKDDCLGLKIDSCSPAVGIGALSRRFLFPPFSILRSYDGAWRKRKRQWLSLGIESEIGRAGTFPGGSPVPFSKEHKDSSKYDIRRKGAYVGKDLLRVRQQHGRYFGDNLEEETKPGSIPGTSVFDPVLCELMYSWFCPEGGQIIDPFAGGSVRGIVASVMGMNYWGCELRPEQVEANVVQGNQIVPDSPPKWVCGDSAIEMRNAPKADFLFSCPPYGSLEVYSELSGDISNMDYKDFRKAYSRIIRLSCRRLRKNRFACFVVANFRGADGFYNDLVGDTIRIFESGGVRLYNDVILATAIGSLPVRVGKAFESSRKLGKAHQNVLIFFKGTNVKEARSLQTNVCSGGGEE